MPIATKRWDDAREERDGLRILVTRYRPRGLPKGEETWDLWMPHLGPSKELHAGAYGKRGLPLSWEVYRAAYLREMREQRSAIAELAERLRKGEMITLLCSSQCVRESRCHRSLLRELVMQQAETAG